LEYSIDLSIYFPDILHLSYVDDNVASSELLDYSCEFTLQGSGLEESEVKVVVSLGAALKIYEKTNRTSAMLIIKEIEGPVVGSYGDYPFMANVLIFEPSDVVFSDDMMDGQLRSRDFIKVTTPTLMTWDANLHLSVDDISDSLIVASSSSSSSSSSPLVDEDEDERDDWKICKYGQDFNGIIDISKKAVGKRIIVTYIVKHFTRLALLGTGGSKVARTAYTICALSRASMYSKSYNIQCCICQENPEYDNQVNSTCSIVTQPVSYFKESELKTDFLLTKYDDDDVNYHLKPIEEDFKVVLRSNNLVKKYRFKEDSNTDCGIYKLIVGNEDQGIRARIEMKADGPNEAKILWIRVPMVRRGMQLASCILRSE